MTIQGNNPELWAVVLAGGDGVRLREYARRRLGSNLPKQFCALHGATTLLQRTVRRTCKLVPAERIMITVSQQHLDVACSQVDRCHVPFAVQPSNRDTTAAVFLSLLHVYKKCPDAVVVVFPSDHYLSPEEAFLTAVLRAANVASAQRGKIVLVGYKPRNWDADLGFIVPLARHSDNTPNGAMAIFSVVEKPDRAMCGKLVNSGAYWNTFIMAGSLSAFLNAGYATVPRIIGVLERLLPAIGTLSEQKACKKAFERIPNSNFTKDVLCHLPDRLLLVPMDEYCHWLDVGRPERAERMLQLLSTKEAIRPGVSGTATHSTVIAQYQEARDHAYR